MKSDPIIVAGLNSVPGYCREKELLARGFQPYWPSEVAYSFYGSLNPSGGGRIYIELAEDTTGERPLRGFTACVSANCDDELITLAHGEGHAAILRWLYYRERCS